MADEVLFEEHLMPGAAWTHVLKRGTALRLTDTEGSANVGAILYNNENPVERLNIPDTLKAQHTAKIARGVALYSDMGRVLASVTEDSVGWHDPLGGCLNAKMVVAKYGETTYQDQLNGFYRNGYDSFLIELEKHGLGPRDLIPNINFFSRVDVEADGSLLFHQDNSPQGSFVEIRAEMNVLLIINSSPHPLDPNLVYAPKPVTLIVKRVSAPTQDDHCRNSRPENKRGFMLTERYFL